MQNFLRDPLQRTAAQLIRRGIFNGEYTPGERLVEFRLAKRYKIGRHSIREALQLLEGEGLITSDAFCGRSVINPKPEEAIGMVLLRVSVESIVATLAAYRVTPAESLQLRTEAQLPSEPLTSLEQLIEWDLSIHSRIWKIAGEAVLESFLGSGFMRFMFASTMMGPEPLKQVGPAQIAKEQRNVDGSHKLLVEGICSGNPATARSAMITHLMAFVPFSNEASTTFAVALGLPIMPFQNGSAGMPPGSARVPAERTTLSSKEALPAFDPGTGYDAR